MDDLSAGSTEGNWEKHTHDVTEAGKQFLTEMDLARQRAKIQTDFGGFSDGDLTRIARHPAYERKTRTVIGHLCQARSTNALPSAGNYGLIKTYQIGLASQN